MRRLVPAVAMVCISTHSFGETQTFSLSPQWNLISFQVIPADPEPAAVFGTLQRFLSAWTYDSATGLWRRYVKPAGTPTQEANDLAANELLDLQPIEPGRAYWVQMSQGTTWEVSGAVPQGVSFPGLHLDPGWNMIGIPVGAVNVTNTEPVSLLAVLTAAGFDYDAMLTYESSSFRKMFRPQDTNSPLASLPPDPPFPNFDLQQDLGRGYFVHVLDPAVLRPRLVATVRPDIDAEPLDNFPSKEDINVSGYTQPATPKSVLEQDTIRFFPGEDVQTIGISNLGDETEGGGGIMLWEAVWTPVTDVNIPEPWIRLFPSRDAPEARDQSGQLLSLHRTLSGVTTVENDIVYLRLDRKNLGRGDHEGTLRLRTSVGDRTYRVVAEVSGLEGDFKGFAVIESVNGRRNPVPDIDLNISFYEDLKVGGLLRGVIDSSQALVWPVDVPLVGYRVADEGNQFVLGGSFVLPPGDQNGEPFDEWNEESLTAGADVDWLNDDRLDVRNPFPFPIQRTVSLEGALVSANPASGYVLEGRYSEVIHGMSREPITLLGSFRLLRQAVRPLSSRRTVDEDTGVEPVVAKTYSFSPPLAIAAGATRDASVSVETEMDLRSLEVTLDFTPPLAHSALRILLRSPGGAEADDLILYDGRTVAKRINTKLLEKVNFPLSQPTESDFLGFLKNVKATKTDSATSSFWRIIISNGGDSAVTLNQWTLRLEGQPVTDVHGEVKNGADPVAGVTVALNGLPFSLYSRQTGADGRFTLSRVPLLPLNFAALRPGYAPADPSGPGLSDLFTRPFIADPSLTFSALETQLIGQFNPLAGAPVALAGVGGFSSGTEDSPFELQLRAEADGSPTIAAGPLRGFVGNDVDFFAVSPADTVRWDFGDGTSSEGEAVSHVFTRAGVYRARLYSPADSGSAQDTVDVVVMPAPGWAPSSPAELGGEPVGLEGPALTANYAAHLFVPSLTMAGVIPGTSTDQGATNKFASDILPEISFAAGETNELGAAYVSTMPLQHTYAASMDIDLAPAIKPPGTSQPFDSDGFVPLMTPDFDVSINSNEQGFKDEDFNYAHVPALWQNTRLLSGEQWELEYDQDPFNGLIVWGNTLVSPHQNYSTEPVQAVDGADYVVARDDSTYHPHPGATYHPDLELHPTVTHYRITCSIGATILSASTPSASVEVAKSKRSQPADPLRPELVAAPAPLARNLHYRLTTGLMATSRHGEIMTNPLIP